MDWHRRPTPSRFPPRKIFTDLTAASDARCLRSVQGAPPKFAAQFDALPAADFLRTSKRSRIVSPCGRGAASLWRAALRAVLDGAPPPAPPATGIRGGVDIRDAPSGRAAAAPVFAGTVCDAFDRYGWPARTFLTLETKMANAFFALTTFRRHSVAAFECAAGNWNRSRLRRGRRRESKPHRPWQRFQPVQGHA